MPYRLLTFAHMEIKHLFFDLDNTLWDHRKNAYLTLRGLFERHKLKAHYDLEFQTFFDAYSVINEALWAKIRDAEIDKAYLRKHRFYDTFLKFDIDDIDLAQVFESQFLNEITQYNELVPYALETLHELKSKKYTLHIITNGFHGVTHRKIDHSGIRPFITTVTSADDVGVRKPHPEIFQHALYKTQSTKRECVLIGDDWIADIIGAQHFGIKAIFYDALKEDKSNADVTVIKCLTELSDIF